MNSTSQLKHKPHNIDIADKIRDARKNTSMPIAWNQFYFVAFKVSNSEDDHYYHALILADDHDAFLEGIASEYLKLLDYAWVKSAQDINVVFVQNLMVQNPALIQAIKKYQTSLTHIKSSAIGMNPNAYSVIGLTDQFKIYSMEVDSDNALNAMDEANAQVMYECGRRFKPLLICQANPVSLEFFALVDEAVEKLKYLLGDEATDRGYLH
jgi:hypothetical protein